MDFGSISQLEILLISLLAVIPCEFIQRPGRTQPVTVHCLADAFLKIVPANLLSPMKSTAHYQRLTRWRSYHDCEFQIKVFIHL